jgi:hypothetical protein
MRVAFKISGVAARMLPKAVSKPGCETHARYCNTAGHDPLFIRK